MHKTSSQMNTPHLKPQESRDMNITEQSNEKQKLLDLLPDIHRTYSLKEAGDTFLLNSRELDRLFGW